MKILHTADLHIGKKLHEHSLLEDQKYILDQIFRIAKEKQVDVVIIAGDVYDRAVPPTEAVTLLDDFLTMLMQENIKVIMISGNHDSPERVAFADRILEKQGLYIAGNYQSPLKTVILSDEYGDVHFVCMPFVKPAVVNSGVQRWDMDEDGSLEPVVEDEAETETATDVETMAAERHDVSWAVEQMLARTPMTLSLMQRYVLVTHYFVTGENGEAPELSDSETDVNVGGLDNVSAGMFGSFDYVALGHIHKPQHIGRGQVYYSGSPLKYSFGEVLTEKSVNLVELGEPGEVKVEKIPLTPMREMRCIKGTLEQLIRPDVVAEGDVNDYLQVTLTDTEELIDPVSTLRSVYPNVLQVLLEKNLLLQDAEYESKLQVERKSIEQLFGDFYEMLKGEPMDETRQKIVQETAEACGK